MSKFLPLLRFLHKNSQHTYPSLRSSRDLGIVLMRVHGSKMDEQMMNNIINDIVISLQKIENTKDRQHLLYQINKISSLKN